MALRELRRLVAGAAGRLVLVLDDAHRLHDAAALGLLGALVGDRTSRLSVIVSSRYELPLPWHRLELAGDLARIGPEGLTFRRTEIAELFEAQGMRIDGRELDAVHGATHGWCVLVRFAVLGLGKSEDRELSLLELAATPRPVVDYLVEEVMSALPSETLEFMLKSSLVDRFTAELADHLTGGHAAGEIELLERWGLPMSRSACAGQLWFRHHPMIGAYMRAEMSRVRPAEAVRVRRHAAEWLASRGLLEQAFEETLSVDDECVVTFLDRHGIAMLLDGKSARLAEFLARVSSRAAMSPIIQLLRVAVAIDRRALADAQLCMDFIAVEDLGDRRQRLLHSMLRLELDTSCADSLPTESTKLLGALASERDPDLTVYAGMVKSSAEMLRHDFPAAMGTLGRTCAIADIKGRPLVKLKAMSRMAFCAGLAGNLREMEARATAGLEQSAGIGVESWTEVELCAAAVASASYLRGTSAEHDELPETAHLAEVAEWEQKRPRVSWHSMVCFGLHKIAVDVDGRRGAAASTRDAMIKAIGFGSYPLLTYALLPVVVGACVSLRELDWAARLVYDAHRRFGEEPAVLLARAQVEYAAGKVRDASADLEAAGRAEFAPLANETYALALRTVIAWRQERSHDAQIALSAGLVAAAPSTLVRPFSDHGEELRPVLDEFVGRFGDVEEFAGQVRSLVGSRQGMVVPVLTAGELRVLRQLPSGDTAEAIADRLCVSVNTIKTHLRSVYRKFGVRDRRRALVVARRCGLI